MLALSLEHQQCLQNTTFSTLGCLVRPQWNFFNQILSCPMHTNPAHVVRLGLAIFYAQGDEENVECAKCEHPTPHLARLGVLQDANGLFSTQSFFAQCTPTQHMW